jgi:hypothetical protein
MEQTWLRRTLFSDLQLSWPDVLYEEFLPFQLFHDIILTILLVIFIFEITDSAWNETQNP